MKKLNELQQKIKWKNKENSNINIKSIQDYTREQILKIFKSFSKQIINIYGFQKRSFLKIIEWKDRNSFILEINWKQIWILTFKNDLQKEEELLNLKNWYIELKSFFLFDEFWKWNIWYLWDFFLQEIKKNFEISDWIYATISKNNANSSLEMFKSLGFKELYSNYWEYNETNIESHLFFDFWNYIKNKHIKLSIMKKYFYSIKKWIKTIEWRSWKQFLNLKIWDRITFFNWNEEITKDIKWINRYKNIKDFLENEWIENCLPWVKNLEEWIKIYENIRVYKEKVENCGIVAIKFECYNIKNMIYDFWVQEPYKSFLISWEKIFEWRLNKWKFKKIKIWDFLKLETWENFLVKNKFSFESFYEMMKNLWFEKIIPNAKNEEEAVNVYYKFYTKEQEKEFGVVAIEVELQK